MHQKIDRSIIKWIVLGIILIGVGLRLTRLSELFHFTYDEEVFAFVGKRMFVNGHIPLIGGVTPMHVHVAPYFYWLSGIFLFFSKLNPLGWGVIAAAVAGITILVLYKTGEIILDKKVGILATFFYSFSFYQNIFDRHYWGLVFDGLLSLVTLLSLYKIVSGNGKYLYLLSMGLAFGLHTDLSTLNLFALSAIVLFFFRPRVPKKTWLVSLILFFISFVPLIVFDLRHNFSNSRGIFQYIDEVSQGRSGIVEKSPIDTLLFLPQTLSRTLYVFGDTDLAKQYSYCPKYAKSRLTNVPPLALLVVFTILAISFWHLLTRKKDNAGLSLKLIFISFLSTYIGIGVYGILIKGDLFDHYLATLLPVFYLLTAWLALKLFAKYPLVIIGTAFIFAFLNINLLIKTKHSYGYVYKEQAVKWAIATVGNNKFSLDVIGDCFKYNGYRYLFYVFGNEPSKSYVDANFTHLYDKPPDYTHPNYLVVFTNPDFEETQKYFKEYENYKRKLIASSAFGRIEVLIVDNSDLDFVGKF